jgi:hypothetical protein
MQLTPTQIKRTLAQFEAQEVPADHSAMAQPQGCSGNIHSFSTAMAQHPEPVDAEQPSDARMCKVVA